MTPLRIGRIAWILSGVRPVIEEIRALAERASAMAGKVPVVASHNG